MNEKMEWISFEIEEREMFEKHLNEMSKQGWNILGMSRDYILYKESDEVKEYIIDICENPNKKDPYTIDKSAKKQIELYEEFGYTLVCNYRNYLIFDSHGQERMIHTDQEVENRLIKEAKRKSRMQLFVMPTIIMIGMLFIFALFIKDYLLYMLSSTVSLLLPIILIIIDLFPLFMNFIINKMETDKKAKIRSITMKVYIVGLVFFAGMLSGTIYNNMLFPIFFIIGFLIIYAFDVQNTKKRIRGEINEGNAKVGFWLFYALIIFLINFSRVIVDDINPMIIGENITGKPTKVIVDINTKSMFARMVDVSLETNEYVYQYTYYDVKETFLSEFITNLIHNSYSKMEYQYDINDTQVYYVEEVINAMNYPDFSISKMALVHGNDMIVLNHDFIEEKEHLQCVIDELGW